MLGVDVNGKTLGVVGMGRIGKAVARRGLGFGMRILYTRRTSGAEPLSGEFAQCRPVTLDELMSSADFVSLHCPLNKETFHLVGKRELEFVKPGAILINTARGAVVDQQALVAALRDGRLGGAGLDVFEDEPKVPDELLTMDNVVLTPHVGSASVETRAAMAGLAVKGLLQAFSGQLPPNAVNPQVWPAFARRLQKVL
jgi:glyoxylate reductase